MQSHWPLLTTLCLRDAAMIGQSVWRFMVDNEEGVVRRNLERAVTHRVDVDFEYYYPALDRWYVPLAPRCSLTPLTLAQV